MKNENRGETMVRNQVFYEILRADEEPFTDESDKKIFLDFVLEVKQQMELPIFAFCLMDGESHFLMGGQSERHIVLAEEQIKRKFTSHYSERHHRQCGVFTRETKYRKYMTEEEILESCLRIHLIPMELKLVKNPEDYWWCSYVDYRRNYRKGIVNTELVLRYLDFDRKKAVRKLITLHHNSL